MEIDYFIKKKDSVLVEFLFARSPAIVAGLQVQHLIISLNKINISG